MLDKMTNGLDFHTKALVLRAERQRALASNIANADTPGYKARDFNFAQALNQASGGSPASGATGSVPLAAPRSASPTMGTTHAQHMPVGMAGGGAGYTVQTAGYATQAQPSMDNNTVDLDRERAAFVDNAVRYEATLRFINGQSKTLLAAITGQ